jgi:hypothetical protein
MPKVSEFFGIVITIYYRDHSPPHFHAGYAGQEAIVAIGSLRLMGGMLPRRALALVLEWANLHRDELYADWDRARQRLPLAPIAPLD